MIKSEERFLSEGQVYFGSSDNPRTITQCNVWDWDQLRMIKLRGTAKLFPPDEDKEVSVLAPIADYISQDVSVITVDDDALLSGISTSPDEDDTWYTPYLVFSAVESLADCRTIQFSKLRELDRLGPGVDLSSYDDESGKTQNVAFKFNPIGKARRLQMAWEELNALKNLPEHPNLVPFDRVVLDDTESRVIGFTTKYIPGGTLDNPSVPFHFEWLQQLTELVDFLNLELGIMHQDIAPRNLLVDPETRQIRLFDFGWVACGRRGLQDNRSDVTGVIYAVYELITNDTHFTSIPHWQRDIEMVQSIPDWPKKRELDSDVSTFREFLNTWVSTRNRSDDMERYLKAHKRLTWPDLPTAPEYGIPYELGKNSVGETNWATGPRSRRTAMAKRQYCFRWERPPQSRLSKQAEDGMQ